MSENRPPKAGKLRWDDGRKMHGAWHTARGALMEAENSKFNQSNQSNQHNQLNNSRKDRRDRRVLIFFLFRREPEKRTSFFSASSVISSAAPFDGTSGREIKKISERRSYTPWAVQDIVVKPIAGKSRSKDMAGMFLSSPEIRTYERASTKEIFLSLPKRLNNAMA